MSTALAILPRLWACEAPEELVPPTVPQPPRQAAPPLLEPRKHVKRGLAFYRKYTEAMLRRCMRLSLDAGRAPSLLGRELFRGKVTSYRLHCFDDAVIFVMDVERCLSRLSDVQRYLILKVAMQEYSQEEAAEMMNLSLSTIIRRYNRAIDKLTDIFLETKMLEPLKASREASRRTNETPVEVIVTTETIAEIADPPKSCQGVSSSLEASNHS